ncbi:MAG: ABC transporter permease [Bifidobacteriaceae bacterium]|jgi:peptide/nickel transport system permease protein|nr:ABC transporter permease [Bifidobacteriaceae bacterium]
MSRDDVKPAPAQAATAAAAGGAAAEATPATPSRWARSDLARVLRSGQVRAGLIMTIIMVIFAIVGPFLAPRNPNDASGGPGPYNPPTDGFPLGTDNIGNDVLSRLLAGGIHLAWMAPASAFTAVLLGAVVGVVAAYYGGVVDMLLMRLMDVLLAFPLVVFIILFVSMVGPKPWLLVVLVVIGMVPGVARVLRGAALPLKEREYVLWATAAGIPARRIMLREYLPNIWSPLMVELGMRLMWSIGALASISYLGYGIQAPDFDWGTMIEESRNGLQTQPWAVLVPVLVIVLFTIGSNIMAEGAARVVARTEKDR